MEELNWTTGQLITGKTILSLNKVDLEIIKLQKLKFAKSEIF